MSFVDYVKSVDANFFNKVDIEETAFNSAGHFLRNWLIQCGYRSNTGKCPETANEVRAFNLAVCYYAGV